MISEVDDFIANAAVWKQELAALRKLVLDCGLVEEWKWKQPCYTHKGTNLIMIAPFKDYCALSFFTGSLLTDKKGLLAFPGENSQASKILKFTSVKEINNLKDQIKSFIYEAIELNSQGKKVEFKTEIEPYPVELLQKMEEMPALKEAFDVLTPGRKRGYILFINGSKNSTTRMGRVEKHIDLILDGKGIHDCICGHSKRMPRCDGSHKEYGL